MMLAWIDYEYLMKFFCLTKPRKFLRLSHTHTRICRCMRVDVFSKRLNSAGHPGFTWSLDSRSVLGSLEFEYLGKLFVADRGWGWRNWWRRRRRWLKKDHFQWRRSLQVVGFLARMTKPFLVAKERERVRKFYPTCCCMLVSTSVSIIRLATCR